MSMAHNTSISKVAHWPWRLPPADRKDGEVRTYYLTPEELEKYKRKDEKKMEEKVIYKESSVKQEVAHPKPSLKEILEQNFATGKKSIDEIAQDLNIRASIVKAAAARLGYIKKKEKAVEKISQKIVFKIGVFNGKTSDAEFEYRFSGNKVTVKQDKRHMIILELESIDDFITEIKAVKEKIEAIGGVSGVSI
ncbi:MAG TPA: hypothetical protein GXX35_11380 [Thermoanaerobacterales bacterium]|nr:hypothetical protein [Thermoanaerobacterales bacterium]